MKAAILIGATALVVAYLPGTSSAQQMSVADGVCETFVIGRDPATANCQGKLMSTAYDSGRVGFYFTFSRGSIITFSGIDRPNPTPDTDVIAVDRIIFNVAGETKHFAATGSCRFGKYGAGHRRVVCKGSSDDGQPFEAIFRMTSPPRG